MRADRGRSSCISAVLALLSRAAFPAAGLSSRPTSPGSWCWRSSPWATTSPSAIPGLLSLGHALFFAAGLYAAGLVDHHARLPAPAPALLAGIAAGGAAGAGRRASGAPHHRRRLHDRDADVRPGRLSDHPLFRRLTRGDEGFVIPRRGARPRPARPRPTTAPATSSRSPSSPSACSATSRSSARPSAASWSRSARTRSARRMLGYDPFRYKLAARWRSPALYAGAAGAAYGAALRLCRRQPSPRCSIRSCRCSGCCSAAPAPCSGRFVGTLLMFYLIDFASALTDAHQLLVVGVALVAAGALRAARLARHAPRRGALPWLP